MKRRRTPPSAAPKTFDPRYLDFFVEFNRGAYFEAHDVLEGLWLREKGALANFYKGLIQIAGAFVHLSKSRSDPARRLFLLAEKHLAPYAPACEGLEIGRLLGRIRGWRRRIEAGEAPASFGLPRRKPAIRLRP